MICVKCNKAEAEWDDLCQECWEEFTSALWWASYDGLYDTEEYEKLLEGEGICK